jgi:threonine dehydrogenase-like Zn-dependent dehydrogenase
MIVPRTVLAVDGLNRIPEGVSFAEASVAEPFACVINGQELAGVGDGDVVVVVGAGPIGCLPRPAGARPWSPAGVPGRSQQRAPGDVC